MDNFFKAVGASIIVFTALFFAVVLGTAFGAVAGWIVGLFFGKTILGILATVGITGFKMWQIGAFLGFVSGFFKTTITK